MSACEGCWTEASWRAMLSGGSTVDHYRRLIENAECHATDADTTTTTTGEATE